MVRKPEKASEKMGFEFPGEQLHMETKQLEMWDPGMLWEMQEWLWEQWEFPPCPCPSLPQLGSEGLPGAEQSVGTSLGLEPFSGNSVGMGALTAGNSVGTAAFLSRNSVGMAALSSGSSVGIAALVFGNSVGMRAPLSRNSVEVGALFFGNSVEMGALFFGNSVGVGSRPGLLHRASSVAVPARNVIFPKKLQLEKKSQRVFTG